MKAITRPCLAESGYWAQSAAISAILSASSIRSVEGWTTGNGALEQQFEVASSWQVRDCGDGESSCVKSLGATGLLTGDDLVVFGAGYFKRVERMLSANTGQFMDNECYP